MRPAEYLLRYLVVADVHANLPALEAVLEAATDFDAVICLGDTIGYGASPNECMERVRTLPRLTSLVGNHDLAALGRLDLGMFNDNARQAAVWTSRRLTDTNRAWLVALSPAMPGEPAHLAHGSPRDPVWEYLEETFQGPPNFAAFEGELCLVGHTHVPRVFAHPSSTERVQVSAPTPGETLRLEPGTRYILNPGSVGQPRDRDPRAAYGLLDVGAGTFTFHRVDYDIQAAQRAIEEGGLPKALALRLALGF